MPINANEYNPKPTAEDWNWAWDKIIKEMQAEYIDAYEAEIDKKTQNQNINSTNEIEAGWIQAVTEGAADPNNATMNTEGARWLIEQIHVDKPDYPYKRKEPTLDGIETMILQLRNQHMKTIKNLKEQNPFT